MKISIILLVLLLSGFLKAQDTIYKRSGEQFAAKIIEISVSEIKYKRFQMQDGPLYVTDKNEILKIKFGNGVIDSFTVTNPVIASEPIVVEQQATTEQPKIVIQPKPFIAGKPYIENPRAGLYYYNNKPIQEKRMLFIAMEKNRVWRNKDLDKAIIATHDFKSNQYISGFGGPAIAIIALIIASQPTTGINTSGALGFNAVGIIIASQILSPIFKRKRLKNARTVVKLYNEQL